MSSMESLSVDPKLEKAKSLAGELAEVSLEKGSDLPDVKAKMKELLASVQELKGSAVDLKMGEAGVFHFSAGDPDKPYANGRFHILRFSETEEGVENEVVMTCIDSKDGGSMLMDKRGNQFEGAPGWMEDSKYKIDIDIENRETLDTNKRIAAIQANRLREIRMTATMARIILES